MKKKLEDAYIPDHHGRREKVLVALKGLDSFVVAYLLKIQKYDLVAVTVINSWEDFTGDPQKSFSCHISHNQLEIIKDFCHKLNIPLHVLKSTSEFTENVIEPWLADKAIGRTPKLCWDCHNLRMELVHQKMKDTGAKHFATGHYAKVFHNEALNKVYVHTSNDEEFDQSALLSRLSHHALKDLMLPLSDLTRKEVLKLADNFGLVEDDNRLASHKCLKLNDDLVAILEKKLPRKFLQDGEITNMAGNENYGQHKGIHHYRVGKHLEVSGHPEFYMGGYSHSGNKIIAVEQSFFVRKNAMLVKCSFSEEITLLEPVKGYLPRAGGKFLECWVYPKSLCVVYIELLDAETFLPGEIVSIIKKKGRNSKIFLTGEVQLLPQEPIQVEGERSVPKVNYSMDF